MINEILELGAVAIRILKMTISNFSKLKITIATITVFYHLYYIGDNTSFEHY